MGSDFAIRPSGGGYRGVLLDWRGTLVVAPTDRWLVRTALGRMGREASDSAADEVLTLLRSVDSTVVDSSAIDTDPALHRAAYFTWFAEARLDGPLAEALYAVESDVSLNPFAKDVGPLLRALRQAGVRVGILSDIHVDLRPAFARHRNPDGSTWADLVDAWMLSFELGVAKPDPKIFALALERLGLPAHEVLMVGDRGAWDGAAAAAGITTLILPPLRAADEERLNRVLDLAAPRSRSMDKQRPLPLVSASAGTEQSHTLTCRRLTDVGSYLVGHPSVTDPPYRLVSPGTGYP